jgi:GAF domain
VYHPDFLTVAWDRVKGNKGARTAGADRVAPALVAASPNITAAFLADTREQLKSRAFTPLPVRERLIPKPGQPGKVRRLGIPSTMDRLVQASLVLVLEPIFEADFKPVSYGFRPRRLFQLQTHQGPCVDCFRTGQPVSVADLPSAGRWPRFTAAAAEVGFAAVHALPMRLRTEIIGALNLFDTTPGALDENKRLSRHECGWVEG